MSKHYTDEDVQALVSVARGHAVWLRMHGYPDGAVYLEGILDRFRPDPWEQLHQFVCDRFDCPYIPDSPVGQQITKDTINKAVELGIVRFVQEA